MARPKVLSDGKRESGLTEMAMAKNVFWGKRIDEAILNRKRFDYGMMTQMRHTRGTVALNSFIHSMIQGIRRFQ